MRTWITRLATATAIVGSLVLAPCGRAADEHPAPATEAKEDKGIGHALMMYLPNRLFDVFDLVRARVRIGPGLSVGARATEAIDLNVGAYRTLWLGLHGPRTKAKLPLPAGLEGRSGVGLLLIETTSEWKYSPNYQWDEIGADVHALAAGVSVGVSIAEAFDLLTGLFFVDISTDDL